MIISLDFREFIKVLNDCKISECFKEDIFIKYNDYLTITNIRRLYFEFLNNSNAYNYHIVNNKKCYIRLFMDYLNSKNLLKSSDYVGFEFEFYNRCGVSSDLNFDEINNKTNMFFLEPILKKYPEVLI